jgi:hypothetical protein
MAASLRKLSSRLQKTNEKLKNLQNPVKTEMINVKVLMEFRTATERASSECGRTAMAGCAGQGRRWRS